MRRGYAGIRCMLQALSGRTQVVLWRRPRRRDINAYAFTIAPVVEYWLAPRPVRGTAAEARLLRPGGTLVVKRPRDAFR